MPNSRAGFIQILVVLVAILTVSSLIALHKYPNFYPSASVAGVSSQSDSLDDLSIESDPEIAQLERELDRQINDATASGKSKPQSIHSTKIATASASQEFKFIDESKTGLASPKANLEPRKIAEQIAAKHQINGAINITPTDNLAIFKVSGIQEKKIFGTIPFYIEVEALINADTGSATFNTNSLLAKLLKPFLK